jgi:hypothetical protein
VQGHWYRAGARVAATGLLAAGALGGVWAGHARTQGRQATQAQLIVQADADELDLLRQHQDQQAASRAIRVDAETDAQAKAATVAKAAAGKAASLAKSVEKAKQTAKHTTTTPAVDIPSSCNEYSGNRAVGCALMLKAGFGLDQMPCLDKMWAKESGWNQLAANGSGAYGIPQAKPGSKMAKYGDDWKSNPATQIKWGLEYIESRYNSPCGAWSSWQVHGWY